MRMLLLPCLAFAVFPALAHDGHLHGALDGPLHHLVAPALLIALCAVAGVLAYWRSRRK